MSYKTNEIPTHRLYKMVSVQFMDINIIGNVKVNTADAASLII